MYRKSPQKTRTGHRPGQSARAKQQKLAQAAPIKTFFTRLFGMNTPEKAWGQGAAGEELVGTMLEEPGAHGWHVEHDLVLGERGANVDHLLIGPPGVFVINTKTLSGEVWVNGDDIHVDGRRRPFVEKQEEEAKRVREKLLEATHRRSLWVQGMLVFVESQLTVEERPANVVVLRAPELVTWLHTLSAKMEPGEVQALVRAAQRDATWQ